MFSFPDPTEYIITQDLDLYNSPTCQELATQAAAGRQCRLVSTTAAATRVQLAEDGYLAWLPSQKQVLLQKAPQPYQAAYLSPQEIAARLEQVIAFAQTAKDIPNQYLWGGTLGPNYDCSGLIQRAFCQVGIWLPRDSYQQEAFTQTINREELQPGDLIFFGTQKVNHVALHLGQEYYIHSSGKDTGRNGIGIDLLAPTGDSISQAYYQKLWGCGRVVKSYQA